MAEAVKWRYAVAAACLVSLSVAISIAESADDPWIEMKSAHFSVLSNAREGPTRSVTWQLEQIRSVLAALWPWAHVDLNRPLGIIAVKDESGMRALTPEFWEGSNPVKPGSVWVGGADGPYIALRTDMQSDDKALLNPHLTVYYSYVSLVLSASSSHPLPLWLRRGLAGVLSNTIVRDSFILIGPPIPWHIQRLRSRARLTLQELVSITDGSPIFSEADRMQGFDAESWALVHFLMFGKEGTLRSQLDQYMRAIFDGTNATQALSAFGRIQDLDGALQAYMAQQIFTYQKASVDLAVKRESFGTRAAPAAESAAMRAAFHVAMGHAAAARTLIDTARAADPASANSYASEALLFDRDGKREEARAAFAKAAAQGSTNGYVHYRLAVLDWKPNPDKETVARIETELVRSIELAPRFSPPVALLAQILWSTGRQDEARAKAQSALALAATDQERTNAQQLVGTMSRR